MNWYRQVLHVMRKDVLMSRWLLLAFAALALGGALSSASGAGTANLWAAVVMPLAGMFITAFLVQADSPVRADSFLATRPLHPSAVWAAKVVLSALVFLVAAMLVHVSVVLAWGGVGSGFLAHAASAAVAVAPWLALALLVALLTPDLRSFVTGLLVLFIGYVTIAAISVRIGGAASSSSWGPSGWVLLGGVLLLGVNQYHTRRVAPGIVLGAVIFLGAWVAPLLQPGWMWAGGSYVPLESRATLRVAEFRPAERLAHGVVRGGDGPERDRLALPLMLVFEGGAAGFQYGARVIRADLVHADGSRETVIRANSEHLSRWRPALVTDEFTWVGPADPTEQILESAGSDTAVITLWVTDAQAGALSDGSASIEVRLSLEAWDVGPGVRLPVQAGASAAFGGVRYRVSSVGPPNLILETASVAPSVSVRSRDWDRPILAVVVRRDLGAAMALKRSSGGSSVATVLGLTVRDGTAALAPVRPGAPGLERDWLTGAELVLGTRRYVGSYPVRVSTSSGQANAN